MPPEFSFSLLSDFRISTAFGYPDDYSLRLIERCQDVLEKAVVFVRNRIAIKKSKLV